MTVFVVLMFLGIVGTAAFTLANLSSAGQFVSTLRPSLPSGSTFNILALLGGVGGTFSVATYGYWVRDKGWRRAAWIPTMRLDAAVGYIVTFIFAFSLFVVGSQFLFTRGKTISGSEGLLTLANPLADTLGDTIRWFFLVGFFFVVFSSLVGGLNGLSYPLADSVRVLRGVPDEDAERYIAQNSRWFRGFLAYCTFPSIAIVLLGQPVFLALLCAAFGALILPLLAMVLLWHLNRRRVARQYTNKIAAKVTLAAALVLFAGLAVQEIAGLF
ncbi:MAG: Nramp family divalent metal transporter [Streptosporangiaceae bacterium]